MISQTPHGVQHTGAVHELCSGHGFPKCGDMRVFWIINLSSVHYYGDMTMDWKLLCVTKWTNVCYTTIKVLSTIYLPKQGNSDPAEC